MRWIAAVLAASAPLLAQEMGMGARRGSGARFEAPYTLNVETPHVKWAKPLHGGPIRLLAVPTVGEGRTLVELAQRLSLDLTTVTIDPNWDLNKWTMAFGKDYGARAEKGDLKLIYSYLEEELTSPKKFDAILLPLNHGWRALTQASRDALARRVKEGCGLVLIRPFASELSPLSPVEIEESETELEERRTPGKTEKSPWKRTGDHYITRGIPAETFPFEDIENFLYRAEPGAQVLIQSESGNPVLAVRETGKGRVVAFGYRNEGMSWHMPFTAAGHFTDNAWEQFYALLVRSIIYAAGREPKSAVDFADGIWRIRDAYGKVEREGKGKPDTGKLAPGRHFLEQQNARDFNISVIEVPQPDRIEGLTAAPGVIAEGGTVEVKWASPRPATVELVDGYGRVIGQAKGSSPARITAGRPLTHSGFVRAKSGTAVAQAAVRFAASSREWDDYEVIMPWFGPHTFQPWIPAVDEQFRKIGITTLASPERNFKIMVSAHLPGFGIYWYRRDGYLKRKAGYAATKDKKYLVREVTLESPAFDEGIRKQLEKQLGPMAALKPMACYLADESSLTFYADAFDVDFSPESIAGFREWARKEYGTLEALNGTWGTKFASWEAVMPMTSEEAQAHGNFAPWADHRAYMDGQFANAFKKARALVHRMDPGGRASISGTQEPTPHNGCNWYELDQHIDYLQPYSGGNQDAMHHLFRPGMTITGFTGYELTGPEAQYQQWQRLFYGHSGASIFWHYTLLNPDLTMSEQGRALAEAFGRIQSGIGRVFMNSRVHEDGVAIHFSPASFRGAWITDGKVSAELGDADKTSANFAELVKRRDAWVKALEKQGVQFRFLATPQIEAGALKDYKVLILPYSIAITDQEAKEIEAFMDRGGVVYADEQTGRMDARCRWRNGPLWREGRKGYKVSGPADLGLGRSFGGDFLVTVRDFGSSKLIGLLPKEARKATLPPAKGVRYDLLRTGENASPEKPVLLVERATRIASLKVGQDLRISLADERGAPVDISVVRMEVRDPSGKVVRHYSKNVTVKDGTARFEIPWALNDPKGTWKVRARDVVSGLTAEGSVER